jgi:hypothetical protein
MPSWTGSSSAIASRGYLAADVLGHRHVDVRLVRLIRARDIELTLSDRRWVVTAWTRAETTIPLGLGIDCIEVHGGNDTISKVTKAFGDLLS